MLFYAADALDVLTGKRATLTCFPGFPQSLLVDVWIDALIRPQPLISKFFCVIHQSLYYLTLYANIRTNYRILLEKLTGPQLVKKFPTFYGT
jgi:hypothetical protein